MEEINYVNVYQDVEVFTGVGGWELVDMEWYQEDGMSCFQYERTIPGVGVELAIVWRPQPVTFNHVGWWERDRTERVFNLTERDWSRWERGLYNDPVDVDLYE